MLSYDEAHKPIDCNFCQGIFEQPIVLPCGEVICGKDVLLLSDNCATFECFYCDDKHTRPENGFPPYSINKHPKFDECKKSLKKVNEKISEVNALENRHESFVFEYFEDLIKQVDNQRLYLIELINSYSNETIKKIKEIRNSCQKIDLTIEKISHDIVDLNTKINKLNQDFNLLTIHDNKIDLILKAAQKLKPQITERLFELKETILSNELYEFKPVFLNVQDMFGSFRKLIQLDSLIIKTDEEIKELLGLCEFDEKTNWKLIYRATRDGFAGKDFHTHCDGKAQTLTLIQSSNLNVFGGYCEHVWTSDIRWMTDEKAFIFSFKNKHNAPIKMKCIDQTKSILCHPNCGPTFGGGYDFCVAENSNMNYRSHSNLGNGYKHPMYNYRSNNAKSFLAGSFNFKTIEIEVFMKVKKCS